MNKLGIFCEVKIISNFAILRVFYLSLSSNYLINGSAKLIALPWRKLRERARGSFIQVGGENGGKEATDS